MLIFAVVFGLLVGGLLGLVGAGGGIIAVPALVYVLGMPLSAAIPTSLIMSALSSAAAVIPRLKGGIRWSSALIVGAAGAPAAFLGTFVNTLLDAKAVLIAFSVVMVAAGIQMLRRRPGLDPAIGTARLPQRVLITIGIGLGVGFLTGLLGVGGGFVIVPALVFFLEIPMSVAIGTSLVITTVNSLSGLLAHAASSHIDWPVTLLFAGSAVVAALITARLARRLSNTVLQRSFAVLVFLAAGYTLVRSLLP